MTWLTGVPVNLHTLLSTPEGAAGNRVPLYMQHTAKRNVIKLVEHAAIDCI